MKAALLFLSAAAVSARSAAPQTITHPINPTVSEIVGAISEDRMAASLRKLESFGTRYVLSAQGDPAHGIGAAKRWIHDQFESYSPRLEVSYQDFTIKKGARFGQIIRDVDLSNVIAVLPGTIHPEIYVLVTAHYDSVALVRKPYQGVEQVIAESAKRSGVDEAELRRFSAVLPPEQQLGPVDFEATAAQLTSPGVTDDGSGVAAVLELARVMSHYRFDKTLAFIAFAGEEVGLSGSQAYAAMAKQAGTKIEAVLNNDIIGAAIAGNGRDASDRLRVFAAGEDDSPNRELARYIRQTGEQLVPPMQIDVIFRGDRFLRGGDQTPFVNQGYPAVRLTSAAENYSNQHSTTDTFSNTSVPYAARVTRINAAALAALALAPAAPVLNWTWNSGRNKGGHVPLLTRGKSEYDAVLHWLPNTEPDLAGYAVLTRSTTSPVWEHEMSVGNVTTFTMPNVSIDDIVIGVKAMDRDGNASLISTYSEPVLPASLTPPASK